MFTLKNSTLYTLAIFFGLLLSAEAQHLKTKDIERWEKTAQQVTIIRDNWGIPHIYGKTDADAVFGLLYAQCEDDFQRIEYNYIEKLGRLAEVKGKDVLYNDLEIRLLIDIDEAKADYKKAPKWLKKLLDSYADAINYYLYKNPTVKPALLTHFEPWFPLVWTDGSIGAISTADLTTGELKSFYSKNPTKVSYIERIKDTQTGSNGFAIAPKKTVNGNAILYINPHTTFYFRPEVQVSSDEGLNAYGAVTWGQFFVYQGFNENCGWMHTSANIDVADMYAEKITTKNGKYFYEFDHKLKPVLEKNITIKYLENGKFLTQTFKTYATNKGPIMAEREGKWISLKSNNRSMSSLIQSWIRTKSKDFDEYKQAMNLKANTSNNTVYADKSGNIAYWHGNFIPIRDKNIDWSKVVDGSSSATLWKGLHEVNETVHLYNPINGWLQNCNSTPFTVAGKNSPLKQNYPPYMAPDGENFRGINAVRIFEKGSNYTLDKVIADAYDTKLSAFEILLPSIFKAFEKHQNDEKYRSLTEVISILKNWNYYATESSIETTLANEWAYKLDPIIQKVYIDQGEKDQVENTIAFAQQATAEQLLDPLLETIETLSQNWRTWKVSWGQINRYQRLTSDIELPFDDTKPSLPIAYGPAVWGSLPSYRSSYQKGSKKRYGFNGNSFVCAVEFGPKIKAKSLLTGGNSGDSSSKHFNDQAIMFQKGQFKEVYFYKDDVIKNAERTYHPGQ